MIVEKKTSAGLRGQYAGKTALCTIKSTGVLKYRGYDIVDLAEKAEFEEVAYLLLYAKLPNASELDAYRNKLKKLRKLPPSLAEVLEKIPSSSEPMEVMRTACSMLGNIDSERSNFSHQFECANRMIALFPSIICYWYRFSQENIRIETATDELTIAGHFLYLLHGKKPSSLHERVMNCSLVLCAEHEFNASTFTARVCASTLSDIYSCVTAAIGSLRGPLHGGANEKAMNMMSQWSNPEEAEQGILAMLAKREKVMGFGHAVYTSCDPRCSFIKQWAEKLSQDAGDDSLYAISEHIENVMWREKKISPNVDFFHATAYHYLDIPTNLFTPIFACSRISGWAAHVMEQRVNNRIIRPLAEYVGEEDNIWLPLAERS